MGETLPLFRASFNLLREVIERTRILARLPGRADLPSPVDPSPRLPRPGGQAEGYGPQDEAGFAKAGVPP